jgi:acyl carrier protein
MTLDRAQREQALIAVICELVHELHPQRAPTINISPSSRIEKDLGIDSLGRTELILRIERTFQVNLPIGLVGEAETVGDVLTVLEQTDARLHAGASRLQPAPLSRWCRPRPRRARSLKSLIGMPHTNPIACT